MKNGGILEPQLIEEFLEVISTNKHHFLRAKKDDRDTYGSYRMPEKPKKDYTGPHVRMKISFFFECEFCFYIKLREGSIDTQRKSYARCLRKKKKFCAYR